MVNDRNHTSAAANATNNSRLARSGVVAVNAVCISLPFVTIFLHLFWGRVVPAGSFGLPLLLARKGLAVFDVAYLTLLASIIVGTSVLLRCVRGTKCLNWCLGTAMLVLLVSVLLDNKVGNVGPDSIAEIPRTNWQEASAYCIQTLITLGISNKQLLLSLSPLWMYGALAIVGRKCRMNCDVRLVATALVVAVCALISTAAATAIRIGRAYTDMDRVQARLDAATRAAIGGISPGERRPGVVIYIGESTGREAGSAFSAALVNEAFKANVVQFADVVSPHSHTSLSLLRALTISADPMYDQLLPDRDLYRANLISVLGKMGIETEWYSNQYRTEWPARLFAVKAKHAQFQDDHSRPAMLEHHGLDSDLLPAITTRVRRMDRSVLMIHSYAGHGPYCDNIPSAYLSSVDDVRTRLPFQASFGDIHVFGREMYLREIECYDAAMSYVADNLRRVMRAVWENGKPVVLIYFSDHGEDVLEGTGHDSGSPSFRKVEVPMFVFFNDAAKQQFATAFQAAQSNRDRPYSLAWISDSIMDIAGLQMKRPLLSIFRPLGYVPDRFSSLRELGGRRTIVAVDNDEAARGRAAIADIDLYEKRRIINTVPLPDREKLCAHRADSLVKFTDAVKAFSCLEVDVVVDPQAGEAYVYHPPKQNNHLTLRALIENAPKGWSKLWLDTKNLTEDNAQFYLGYLNSVFPPEQRHKVLVETTIENVDDRTAAALTSFRKSDYMLSYYLPTDAAIRCSRLAIDVGCGAFAMHVQKVISTLPYNSLSFDVHAKGFAEHLKTKQNIDLNTWDETLTSKADLDLALLRVVGMYVIPYRSKFDY